MPALYTDSGIDYVGKDANYSKQKRDEYTEKDYHKVSDEIKPDWDLAGAVDDAQLLTTIGYRVAQGEKAPEWKPGSEFKAKRDETMRGATPVVSVCAKNVQNRVRLSCLELQLLRCKPGSNCCDLQSNDSVTASETTSLSAQQPQSRSLHCAAGGPPERLISPEDPL